MNKPIRVLIAKPGLDGHDRGAKVVALALRDAGFEVIYSGLHQTAEEIVTTAVQEDVDVIGLSILSGAHLPITAKVMQRLREATADDEAGGRPPAVLVGGCIPQQDVPALKEMGVWEVFPTGSRFEEIIRAVKAVKAVNGIHSLVGETR
jgi:methylmalonyl-CoA mutase, C-terminal domain